MTQIQKRLFALEDKAYGDFCLKLTPGLSRKQIIGVRSPELKKLAKESFPPEEISAFMADLPHEYYEENNLHGLFIQNIKDYDECIAQLEHFLPYVDNWASCDTICPNVFKKHRAELLQRIYLWLESGKTYTVRFGIRMLMNHYLDEDFKPEYLELVARVQSQEYYVNMMRAWYFATALAKQYEATVPIIESGRLDTWTHNKAIQKAIESRRVSQEQKNYLRSLKQKEK